jgi:hypothetical protein
LSQKLDIVAQLLRGECTAQTLFSRVPFDRPPRWIRIRRFRHRFARGSSAWWERSIDDPEWMRPIDRDDLALNAYLARRGW